MHGSPRPPVSAMLFPNRNTVNAHYQSNDMYNVDLFGTDEGYAHGGQVDIHLGRFFTDEESLRKMPVVGIGADVEMALFAHLNPIGKEFKVYGHHLVVIGT